MPKFKNSWFLEVEAKQEERKGASGGKFFAYANGDPIPVDWCLTMRLDKKNKPDELPDEVKEVVERLVKADLYVKHHLSVRLDEIYIQVGATRTAMMNEASNHMIIQMAVLGCHPARGTIPFHTELTKEFQTEQDYRDGVEFRFHSGERQRIIMNIIKRVARIDPEQKVLAPNRLKLLAACKAKAEEKKKGMQRWQVKELLEANLCTTMTSLEAVTRQRLPKCMELYSRLLKLEEEEVKQQGSANPGDRVDVQDCLDIIAELEAETDTEATGFICEMVGFFPLHDPEELQELFEKWADWSNMKRWSIPWPLDHGTRVINSWGMFYQPTSKIRDYFGDHTALYFAWLQLYTRWLRYAALIGAMVMLGNVISDTGIDGNPLVLSYSIFLSLWSTLFVEAWVNRENELKFLWGSQDFEANEQPRPQFKGVIREDPVTKVKVLVHESAAKRYGKTFVSFSIIGVCIVAVVIGAYAAYAIRQIYKVDEETCLNPCATLEAAWKETNQDDDWTDFVFVAQAEEACLGAKGNGTHSFCVFERPVAGAENGKCREAAHWLNGTMCAGDKQRFAFDKALGNKDQSVYRAGADISVADAAASQANCVGVTGRGAESLAASCVRSVDDAYATQAAPWQLARQFGECDCIYTPYSVGGEPTHPTWWARSRWKLLSSLINLILIQGGGQAYERLAGRLNQWENHRTQTEYTDSLILKACGFQFINNVRLKPFCVCISVSDFDSSALTILHRFSAVLHAVLHRLPDPLPVLPGHEDGLQPRLMHGRAPVAAAHRLHRQDRDEEDRRDVQALHQVLCASQSLLTPTSFLSTFSQSDRYLQASRVSGPSTTRGSTTSSTTSRRSWTSTTPRRAACSRSGARRSAGWRSTATGASREPSTTSKTWPSR